MRRSHKKDIRDSQLTHKSLSPIIHRGQSGIYCRNNSLHIALARFALRSVPGRAQRTQKIRITAIYFCNRSRVQKFRNSGFTEREVTLNGEL